jgi:hypothetical protein
MSEIDPKVKGASSTLVTRPRPRIPQRNQIGCTALDACDVPPAKCQPPARSLSCLLSLHSIHEIA